MPRDVLHEIRRRSHVSRIIRANVARKECPIATDSRIHGNVLTAVRASAGHGIAHDPRADLEFRQHLARLSVSGLEPSVERTVKHDIPRGNKGTAPTRKFLLVLPNLLASRGIPRYEGAEISPGSRSVRTVGPDERRTLEMAGPRRGVIHAKVGRGRVKQLGAWRKRRR